MSLRELFVLTFILYILVAQFAATRFYTDEEKNNDDDDDEYRLLRRFLFQKSAPVLTQRAPSVRDNLVHPSSLRPTTQKLPSSTQKTTYAPSYLSNPCVSHSCEHGGICIPTGQMTYECKCVGPWRGIFCSIADACYRSPCLNGGTCLNVHDDYWCKCTSDYYGNNCQTKFSSVSYLENDHCRPNICNGGQCISLKTTYYCNCLDNRYGEHCEKRFSKRKVSNLRSYYNLLVQHKRNMMKSSDSNLQKTQRGEEVAYYDAKNGIYF